MRKISASEFEKIILRSYKKTMQVKGEAMPENLESLVKQNFKKIPGSDVARTSKIRKQTAGAVNTFGLLTATADPENSSKNASATANAIQNIS